MNKKSIFCIALINLLSVQAFSQQNNESFIGELLLKINQNSISKEDVVSGANGLSKKKPIQCLKDELLVSYLVNNKIKELQKALLTKNLSKNLNYLETAKVFPAEAFKADRSIDDIQIQKISAPFRLGIIQDYLTSFSIRDADLSVVDTSVPFANRKDDLTPTEINLLVKFDFRGYENDLTKRQDRGELILKYANKDNDWNLAEIKFNSLETLKSKKQPTYKLSQASLDVPVLLRSEAIRRGGYALSNADINNDGIPDLLVATRDGVQLFLGTKSGYVLKKDSGLEKLTFVKTAIFADLNNSGKKDLVLTRLVGARINDSIAKKQTEVLVYKGDGKGQFTLVANAINNKKNKFLEPMPAAIADFNGDGLLDIYIGYPGKKDFTASYNNKSEKDMQPQGVYLNQGNYKFKDFTDEFVKADFNSGKLFPHASLAANIDQKNGVDLLVADDRGNLSPAFLNNGTSFNESAEVIGLGNKGYGMGIAVGDFNNDGITDILYTNVNTVATDRLVSSCQKHFGVSDEFIGSNKGLRLYKGTKSGSFEEVKNTGLDNSGYGAAGVVFVDYNHDGLQDIYLTNGLWSGTPDGDELDSLFAANVRLRYGEIIHALKDESSGGFKDFLYGAQGSLDYVKNIWTNKKKMHPSLAGFQRNRLFRNNGDGTFEEVAYFEGVDSIADGYVVGKADVNHDGVEDLVLRNADPGSMDYTYSPVEVYVNQNPKNSSVKKDLIAIHLEGVKSPKDAYGSFVIVERENGTSEVQHLIANSGSMQDEAVLRFYLGGAAKLKSLTVHWTSGAVQTMKDVAPGEYYIKENVAIISSGAEVITNKTN